MGTIVSLIIGGLFCTFTLGDAPFIFRYGWAFFFYLLGKLDLIDLISSSLKNLGGLGIIWSVVWLIFASDTPVGNKHISEKEKEYIRACKAEEKIQDTRTVRSATHPIGYPSPDSS